MVASIERLPAEPVRIGNARGSLSASGSVFMFIFMVVDSLEAIGVNYTLYSCIIFSLNKIESSHSSLKVIFIKKYAIKNVVILILNI